MAAIKRYVPEARAPTDFTAALEALQNVSAHELAVSLLLCQRRFAKARVCCSAQSEIASGCGIRCRLSAPRVFCVLSVRFTLSRSLPCCLPWFVCPQDRLQLINKASALQTESKQHDARLSEVQDR